MHSETTDGSLENITQYLILPEAFSTSDCTSEVPTECVHQEKGIKRSWKRSAQAYRKRDGCCD